MIMSDTIRRCISQLVENSKMEYVRDKHMVETMDIKFPTWNRFNRRYLIAKMKFNLSIIDKNKLDCEKYLQKVLHHSTEWVTYSMGRNITVIHTENLTTSQKSAAYLELCDFLKHEVENVEQRVKWLNETNYWNWNS
jgi:hypothetical protein